MHEGVIWVMGGRVSEEQEVTISILTYDAEADAWGTAPPLPSPRWGCSAVTMDGGIFLWDRDGSFKFQYRNAEWSEVAGEVSAFAACGALLLG